MTTNVTELRLQTICLLAITAIAVGWALYFLKPVLIPLGLAVVLHLGLTPFIDLLIKRARFPRAVATLSALLVAAGALTAAGALVVVSVRRLTIKADLYTENFWSLTERMAERIPLLAQALEEQSVRQRVAALPVQEIFLAIANALLDVASNLMLVLIFAIFLLIGHRPDRTDESPLRLTIESRVRRYLITKVAVSAATGVLVAGILSALQVELALVFGLLAFGLNFIPNIGSIIATLLPLPMVLVSPDASLADALLVILLPGAVQITIGNLLEPKLMGDSLDLHPVTVLSALVFWGSLWGVTGMLLAAPMTAVLRIALEEVDITAPIAHLMAGRSMLDADPDGDSGDGDGGD